MRLIPENMSYILCEKANLCWTDFLFVIFVVRDNKTNFDLW